MSDYPEIFVLRHGQTEWNSVGRHQGRLNSQLTNMGRGQAAEQGDLLADLLAGRSDAAAFCSPQGRALETAGIALAPLGVDVQVEERLCEISFGQWEALTFEEIADGWPEHCKYADQNMFAWHFQAPGGENFAELCGRAASFLRGLTGPSIIVTHGITSRVLRGLWLGIAHDGMAALPGGQGRVYHLNEGVQRSYPAD